MDPRAVPLSTLFDSEKAQKIRASKVLLVGAGGIGCELLKDLVVAGVGEVHVVDLDTIDLSNLNRQFLFGPEHIKQPKATVAAQVASQFNTNVHIVPYTGNITSAEFNAKWFRGFALVFNALDNATARRHVNKMCIATNVPLVDVGSEGFNGQSQVIIPQKTECYDCFSHPTPKSFPVCTIRSTPTQPIHCIVWAKSFLLSTLFGEEAAPSEQNDENETTEQVELVELKSQVGSAGFVKQLAEKIYIKDIQRLAGNETMWEDREPPRALEIPAEFDALDAAAGEEVVAEDQVVWSAIQNLQALVTSVNALVTRQKQGEGIISFDKDDDDTLDFVCAAANLRAMCFGIEPQSKWETKSIAGNIIPAVASTNAIVAGLATIEALKVLGGVPQDEYRSVNIFRGNGSMLSADKLQPRKESCVICGIARTTVMAPANYTLDDLVNNLLKLKLGYDDVSLLTDKLIYDPDFDDNLSRSLSCLGITDNFVTVVDDEERRVNLELYVEGKEDDEATIEVVSIPLRPQKAKRQRSDDDDVEAPPTKKEAPEAPAAVEANGNLFADEVIDLD